MTIWEKAILNMQKGVQKITAAAAVFSERVKVEIALIRLRIRINEIHAQIDELYKTIGRRLVDLTNKGDLPKTSEQLLYEEVIAGALAELVQQKKEIADLMEEIKSELDSLKPAPKEEGPTA